MRRLPWITLMIVGLAVLVHFMPGAILLAYDRAAILQGEWWRLITGHWVHFSAQHFLYDTAAFGIIGTLLENRGRKLFAWLCLSTIVTTSLAMLVFEPHLQLCGGLSGLATAAFVSLALEGLEEQGMQCWISGSALVFCAVKLLFELVAGKFLVLQTHDSFVPVPSNHIAGALTAVAMCLWRKQRRNSVPTLSSPGNSQSPSCTARVQTHSDPPCFSGSSSRGVAAPRHIPAPPSTPAYRAQSR